MADNVTVASNTQEEVAFKLMNKIIGTGVKSKHDVLHTYHECLLVVKGHHPENVIED